MRALSAFCMLGLCALATAARLAPAAEGVTAAEGPFPGLQLGSDINKHGTHWAVLIAGSAGYGNYRHQADVYHAYQILVAGGLKPEHIIVMHNDDIANAEENPKKGTVINKPDGPDVYKGVPKDYIGEDVTAKSFLAVLTGDKEAVAGTGGSKRVLESTAADHVFVYFCDHGGAGILGMPHGPFLYAKDLNKALVTMHDAKQYKRLVFYVEACESGSIFDGLLPADLNIYVTTAANPTESSWGYYCPGMDPPPPEGYGTCLGDLYSIAFLEDDDASNLKKESLKKQYQEVKDRTSQKGTYTQGSHVMQYGTEAMDVEKVGLYLTTHVHYKPKEAALNAAAAAETGGAVAQRDADLLHLWAAYQAAPEGSEAKARALQALAAETSARAELDKNMAGAVGAAALAHRGADANTTPELLAAELAGAARPAGQAVVDDFDCLKGMVRAFEGSACNAGGGRMPQSAMKHARPMANLCNEGVAPAAFAAALATQCHA